MKDIMNLIMEGKMTEAGEALDHLLVRKTRLLEGTFGTEADLSRDMGRISPENDEIHTLSLKDTRKPALTLMMLNRMNKIRSTKKLELAQKSDVLQLIFGGSEEEQM